MDLEPGQTSARLLIQQQ